MNIELIKPQTQTPLIIQWKEFQHQLGRYNGSFDDWYDTSFIQVIQEYQKEKNLLVDGYIGTNTWYAAYQEGMSFTLNQKKSFPTSTQFWSHRNYATINRPIWRNSVYTKSNSTKPRADCNQE
ncbi:peptidoglycan hydrolase-like protein with peptidoglycan-binding domain [Myroides gitamensis]|nr:peptidoglycan hydrolase-like protein with peptidoglycan-binding domain [Myroides gitamensis]